MKYRSAVVKYRLFDADDSLAVENNRVRPNRTDSADNERARTPFTRKHSHNTSVYLFIRDDAFRVGEIPIWGARDDCINERRASGAFPPTVNRNSLRAVQIEQLSNRKQKSMISYQISIVVV